MQRDDAHLLDILAAAKGALRYVEGMTKEEFLQDEQLQDAVIRRLEVVGEASRRVSDSTRATVNLPWTSMIGMRNFLIHAYDSVDLNIVWSTASISLLPVVELLERILNEDERSSHT